MSTNPPDPGQLTFDDLEDEDDLSFHEWMLSLRVPREPEPADPQPETENPEGAFNVRVRAARKLVDGGDLDGALALSYVLWPSEDVASACATASRVTDEERQAGADELRRRVLELVDQGLSQREAGAKFGVPRSTVQLWLQRRERMGVYP